MYENKFGLELIAAVKQGAERLKYADKKDVMRFLERAGVIPTLNEKGTIELCENCKGEGIVYWDECTNYHKGEYETYSKECPYCEGSGRMIVTEHSAITRRAFKPSEK
jgi:DnaJ-class molecular chaperone